MDFIESDVRQLFRKFLLTSLGSAAVVSVYAMVDTIAVGRAEGPAGSAAMAVISPLYGLGVFLAIMCGIGGSVLMSAARGRGEAREGDGYFTATMGLLAGFIVVTWLALLLFGRRILTFFGADNDLLPLVMRYADWIIGFWPVYMLPICLEAFVRNDGAPGLAMASVVIGGGVNMFGDWFFVFPLGMGIRGAAIATVIGMVLQFAVVVSYFFRKRCRLRLARPRYVGRAVREILTVGFGAGVLDCGTVFLAVILNNQIMTYGGADALACFGVLTTLAALFQALFGGVGQAVQPLVSSNFGAGRHERVRSFFCMGLLSALALGSVFTLVTALFPRGLVRLFMTSTQEVLAVAPRMFRLYAPDFFFLSLTVFATYFLQSILRSRMSMAVALLRSFLLSGALLCLLPRFWGLDGVMLALPLSEAVATALATVFLCKASP